VITALGLLDCALLGLLPYVVDSARHALTAGIAAALVCFCGLMLASIWLATFGAVLTLSVFAVSAMMSLANGAVLPAILLGLFLFILLDTTYFRSRFREYRLDPAIVRSHLRQLAELAACAIVASAALVAVALAAPMTAMAAIRPVIAAMGALLAMFALVRALSN
jgi:hypothetical protein